MSIALYVVFYDLVVSPHGNILQDLPFAADCKVNEGNQPNIWAGQVQVGKAGGLKWKQMSEKVSSSTLWFLEAWLRLTIEERNLMCNNIPVVGVGIDLQINWFSSSKTYGYHWLWAPCTV